MNHMETDNKIMISCKESTFLISKKQQDKLSMSEKMKLQFHLMMCKYCRRFADQISFIQKAIKRLREKIEAQGTKLSLNDEQKARMKEALNKKLK